MVGFTCYLWNIDRSLWVAAQLKAAQPDVRIVLGGPEITTDNAWVLDHAAVDFAVFGEGEQTLAELLGRLAGGPAAGVPGLWTRGQKQMPPPRTPLADLAEISSPYLDGILDAADERMLLLETARGCIFKCRFCYYPKSYDKLYQLSYEHVAANLQHAAQRGGPRGVFAGSHAQPAPRFCRPARLLARHNPDPAVPAIHLFGRVAGRGDHRRDGPAAGGGQFCRGGGGAAIDRAARPRTSWTAA